MENGKGFNGMQMFTFIAGCQLGACKLLNCLNETFPAIGARCRLAYGPADATAAHCLLLQ